MIYPKSSSKPLLDAQKCCGTEPSMLFSMCVGCQSYIWWVRRMKLSKCDIQVEESCSRSSISWSKANNWNNTITLQWDLHIVFAFSHFECAYTQTLKHKIFKVLNARIIRSNTILNENVEKCEFFLYISRNWGTSYNKDVQSTWGHSYTFKFCFVQCLAHLWKKSHTHMLLHITSMLSYLQENLHIFLHTKTYLHI